MTDFYIVGPPPYLVPIALVLSPVLVPVLGLMIAAELPPRLIEKYIGLDRENHPVNRTVEGLSRFVLSELGDAGANNKSPFRASNILAAAAILLTPNSHANFMGENAGPEHLERSRWGTHLLKKLFILVASKATQSPAARRSFQKFYRRIESHLPSDTANKIDYGVNSVDHMMKSGQPPFPRLTAKTLRSEISKERYEDIVEKSCRNVAHRLPFTLEQHKIASLRFFYLILNFNFPSPGIDAQLMADILNHRILHPAEKTFQSPEKKGLLGDQTLTTAGRLFGPFAEDIKGKHRYLGEAELIKQMDEAKIPDSHPLVTEVPEALEVISREMVLFHRESSGLSPQDHMARRIGFALAKEWADKEFGILNTYFPGNAWVRAHCRRPWSFRRVEDDHFYHILPQAQDFIMKSPDRQHAYEGIMKGCKYFIDQLGKYYKIAADDSISSAERLCPTRQPLAARGAVSSAACA